MPSLADLALKARLYAPGLALALAVALAAMALDGVLAPSLGLKAGVTVMVLGLVIGMLAHPVLARVPATKPGVTFNAKIVLRWGVALLGLRVALGDVWALGPATLVLILGSMALTIGMGVLIARAFGRSTFFGLLTGGATAICGASATLAISSVLPRHASKNADTLFSVAAMNALSTLAMVAYPLIALKLGFDATASGIFFGAAIHDVAQVVGAGSSVSDEALETATIVKLTRVLLLVAVVAAIAFAFRDHPDREGDAKLPVPGFALMFCLLVVVNSLGLVPEPLRLALLDVSKWFLVTAICALGLQTSVGAMAALGWRHIAVVFAQTGAQLTIVLGLMFALGLAAHGH